MSAPASEPAPDEAPAATEPDLRHRRIRSFVMRGGRTTEGQARARATLGPRFLLPFQTERLDLDTCFERSSPTVLEIGFGMGDATAQIAATLPDINFLACEVHEPGVGSLLRHIGERRLENIRIVAHDAVEVLEQMVAPGSLAGVHLFFPDPWHKARHHKRRLVQSPFIAQLVEYIAPGGYFHAATDWAPYAEQMLGVLRAEPRLVNTATDYAPRPAYRPETKFERRGLRLGHGVWDLVFRRV